MIALIVLLCLHGFYYTHLILKFNLVNRIRVKAIFRQTKDVLTRISYQ